MFEENRTDDAGNEQEIRLPPDLPDNGHDSDHPSIWMPFSVFIDGQELEGVGISLVAAYVGGWGGADLAGRDLIARFSFQFDGYSIVLPIEVRAGLEDRRSGAYKLVFLDPTGPHLAHLRYMMNAYLAGDLIEINEVLRIPPEYKKKSKVLEPPKPPTVKERLRKVFGLLWVGALTVALIALTVWTIHYHIFVHKVPGLATVTPAGLPLTAPEAGQIAYVDSQAPEGGVVFSLQSARGGVLNFSNPCNCDIMLTSNGTVGATVLPGTPIAYVKTGDAGPTIKVVMPDDLSKMLLFGAEAEARLPDGQTLPLTVVDVKAEEGGSGSRSIVSLSAPSGALGAGDIGKTVALTVTSKPYANLLTRIRAMLPFSGRAQSLSQRANDWPLIGNAFAGTVEEHGQ
ncbi:hypothetical protein FF124_04425 [Martelella lutilitoris]|uniref:Uncharacterized protein n=1 Tax=Martelella lutilitoris TaxID=2583532 RepID=A0A5C4JX44_9HYPH|nr:hypothetical protein [Martelella lutilitoris]TNB49239.1 hypothetical protein FF124_04425 [Martelella lutilitoris]